MKDVIIHGDVLSVLPTLGTQSVNCIVTSPPYYGLRDYGVDGQIGLEPTPDDYVAKMVAVFREVRRVLRDDGTLWLNLGDSYNGYPANVKQGRGLSGANQEARHYKESGYGLTDKSLKPKDLIGIPWRVALALQADGWYLRQDIIWSKNNPMPESVTDRCTRSHEYIFMLSKSPRYYYDAASIREKPKDSSIARWAQNVEAQHGSERVNGGAKTNGAMKAVGGLQKDKQRGHSRSHAGFNERWDAMTKEEQMKLGANKRSVWTVATKPFPEAHFATFPPELIIPCILAGCPPGGTVLDPFMGSGTTAVTARRLDRHYVGIEINADYINIANRRLSQQVLWSAT